MKNNFFIDNTKAQIDDINVKRAMSTQPRVPTVVGVYIGYAGGNNGGCCGDGDTGLGG